MKFLCRQTLVFVQLFQKLYILKPDTLHKYLQIPKWSYDSNGFTASVIAVIATQRLIKIMKGRFEVAAERYTNVCRCWRVNLNK